MGCLYYIRTTKYFTPYSRRHLIGADIRNSSDAIGIPAMEIFHLPFRSLIKCRTKPFPGVLDLIYNIAHSHGRRKTEPPDFYRG